MRICKRLIIKCPGVRHGTNVKLAIRTEVRTIPLALVRRPERHAGSACFGSVSQCPRSNSSGSVKRITLIVIISILPKRRICGTDGDQGAVELIVPGIDRFQSLMRPGAPSRYGVYRRISGKQIALTSTGLVERNQ